MRRRAEARLRKRSGTKSDPSREADTQKLLHELRVHQIELEIQNSELRVARDNLEEALEKCTDLFDFAPVGYFSVDEQSKILEVNLRGAHLQNMERGSLVKRRFHLLVSPKTRQIYYQFLENVFSDSKKQVCEVALMPKGGPGAVGGIERRGR